MNREECLAKAKECVCGQREQDYGSPERNFETIADLWTAYLQCKYVFRPVDVAMMMVLLKVARVKSGNGKDDNFVDGAGYFACAAEVASAEITSVQSKRSA